MQPASIVLVYSILTNSVMALNFYARDLFHTDQDPGYLVSLSRDKGGVARFSGMLQP